ncbi:glycosyltransferase family 39 protein [Patescibacteria group bacterium]|nr:glycosyltransferase family 39 protein [Patescibacteria group bacterium]
MKRTLIKLFCPHQKKFLISWLVTPIILGALSLRLIDFGHLPSILNRDEAALAYNAYLLKEIGLDEWGRAWPLTLESFGDYKLIGYPTILVGLFSLFGENDWVVRLPSFMAGLALALAIWKLSQWLGFSKSAGHLTVLMFATTPIFFFYSRIAFEAHLALGLFVWGVYLLLSALDEKPLLSLKSVIGLLCLLMACLTYNTPLLFLPAVLPVLVIVGKQAKQKVWWLASGLGLIFCLVVFWLWPVLSQKSGITIFTDLTVWSNWILWRDQLPLLLKSSLGHRFLYWAGLMIINFVKSFSPDFLVTGGGAHPWHSLPNWGHLTWPIYGLGFLGMWRVVKDGLTHKFSQLTQLDHKRWGLLLLMALSLAPAVVTVDAPHTTRSLFFIFIWVLWAGLGLDYLLSRLPTLAGKFKLKSSFPPKIKLLGLVIFVGLLIGNFAWYLGQYWWQYPADQPRLFQAGFDQVIKQVDQDDSHQPVAIVDASGYQYILLAWYLKIDPELYLKTNIRQLPDTIGMKYGQQVDRYHFIAHQNDRSEAEKTLVWWDEVGQTWQRTDY